MMKARPPAQNVHSMDALRNGCNSIFERREQPATVQQTTYRTHPAKQHINLKNNLTTKTLFFAFILRRGKRHASKIQ